MAPVGEDMAHVRIALGYTAASVFSSSRLPAGAGGCEKIEAEREKYLDLSGLGICDERTHESHALYLLWQVDGNYFLLLYALSAIMAVIVVGKLKSGFLRGSICRMLVPFILFNVTITRSATGAEPWD